MAESSDLPVNRQRFHYAWVVVAITFLVLIGAAAVRATPGILIVPLEREFGWSRAAISAVISLNLLLYGLAGPFAAGLIDRFGPRRVMLTALSLLLITCLFSAALNAFWQFGILWGAAVGLGTGMTAIVLGITVVHRWFERHRGTMVGVLTASTATGQLLFLPFLARVIESDGWRVALLVVAGVLGLLLPLVLIWMRDRPDDLGLAAYGGVTAKRSPDSAPVRRPFADALTALGDGVHSRPFWFLTGSFFVCGASTNGLIGTHLVPACVDHGIPEVAGAGLLATMGVFDLVGTTASGWLSDRINSRTLLFWYYGLRGFSLLLLPASFASHGLAVFAVFYGLDWIATVPPTVALTSSHFGKERAGLMFGWIVAFHQLGASCATASAGWIRTLTGTYDAAFWISGYLCIATAVAMLYFPAASSTQPAPGRAAAGV